MKTAEPGSVSHGTMREEDLIPTFCCRLEELAMENYPLEDNVDVDSVNHLEKVKEIRGRIDESCEGLYYGSEDAGYDLESLFDALDEYAPEGYYFGSHPGDSSDYGFWQCEELRRGRVALRL